MKTEYLFYSENTFTVKLFDNNEAAIAAAEADSTVTKVVNTVGRKMIWEKKQPA